ncbi:MAG: 2Fe-2S iron-sulfur cluster binding domain-containing protein [Symploca sp. SIO3C6]|uniref:2Fe-2S iron-sulfur cluster binding domain-containing protein n=1 Tax=Symploca sp. SIO1C4 TaxID=2607765 RepID=A0A6B3NLE6_9CYAN|nr:2Fe-2S iron-sulfur cluster binding domain-containing protein [Symploca sp. SIO3C6]NER31755.1 2Fe-2S iron-sulfur cluster binding domain-containing protein [Symploca sp. SIO1C4]NET07563.1 2Fe-2S iron-sulfur cluster binding domain-containing protein [Symploca sp. SIO2B6]
MAVYQVRLVNQALNLDHTISVPDDQYILDVVEQVGLRLLAGCREGTCSSCVAKVVSGGVVHSGQKFLQPSEIQAGYTLTCVAYPVSDCTLETHQEQVLYKSSLYFKSDHANNN